MAAVSKIAPSSTKSVPGMCPAVNAMSPVPVFVMMEVSPKVRPERSMEVPVSMANSTLAPFGTVAESKLKETLPAA